MMLAVLTITNSTDDNENMKNQVVLLSIRLSDVSLHYTHEDHHLLLLQSASSHLTGNNTQEDPITHDSEPLSMI